MVRKRECFVEKRHSFHGNLSPLQFLASDILGKLLMISKFIFFKLQYELGAMNVVKVLM